MMKSKTIGAALLLIATTVFFFYPAIHNGFLKWDDQLLITENKEIQNHSIANINRIFTFEYAKKIHQYHPLVFLLFMMEYRLFGLQPAGFHGINILFHCLNTLLIFWLILLISRRISWSLSTALLFSLHPVHVQSVVWVTELKDLLYSFFFLAALISYWKYSQNKKHSTYLLCFIFALFSTMAKSMAVTLPFLFLLMDYYKEKKLKLKKVVEKIPFFIISAFLFSINVYIMAGYKSIELFDINFNFKEKAKSVLYGILFLIHQIFIPLRLSPRYPNYFNSPYHLFSFFWLPGIMLIAITIYFVIIRDYQKEIRFGLLFFWIVMLPILGLLFYGYSPYDHYLYMSILGLIFAFVGFTGKWLERIDPCPSIYKKTALVTLLLIAVFFGLLSRRMIAIWKDDLTLWNAALNHYPTYIAFHNRGKYYIEKNEVDNAIRDFISSLKMRNHYETLYNLGRAYEVKGDIPRAYESYNRALALMPSYFKASNNRGALFFQMGKFQNALDDFNSALKANPNYTLARINRGILYLEMKQFQLADQDFFHAINVDSDSASAFYYLSLSFIQQQRFPQALKLLNHVIQLSPDLVEARYNRGLLLLKGGWRDQAENDFMVAVSRQSNFLPAQEKLLEIYIELKKGKQAESICRRILIIDPRNQKALDYLKNRQN
jgi:tetratricopeptide (TPR) repeat protein